MKLIPSFNNKVYLINNYVQKEHKREANIYPILKKHKIPTPRIKQIKQSLIQLYYYPSKTIKENPTQKSYEKIGKIYQRLHRIKGDSTEFTESIYRHFNKLPKYMQKKLNTYLSKAKGNRLIHCDPSTTNILIGKHIKLIDFEFTKFGDPTYDIALFELKNPQQYHKAFYKGYNKTHDANMILFYKILQENHTMCWAKKNKKINLYKEKKKQRDLLYEKITKFLD